jgi:hypothetical protein
MAVVGILDWHQPSPSAAPLHGGRRVGFTRPGRGASRAAVAVALAARENNLRTEEVVT